MGIIIEKSRFCGYNRKTIKNLRVLWVITAKLLTTGEFCGIYELL
jgi:hypothetical protein